VLLGHGMYNVPASNRYARFTGFPATTAPGVTSNTAQAGALVLVVGSGQYVSSAP
jgi:hypothetical protein